MATRVVLLLVILATTLALPTPSQQIPKVGPPSTAPIHIRRQNGNSDAASDLYGLGIRVSAYLQVLGMLLSCLRDHNRSRIGIKLLSSAVCVALLASWTVLGIHQTSSPCEAWLVLSLINAYGTARSTAINDTGKKTGGIAIMFAATSLFWQDILFLWFFSTLYRDLPRLGTYNLVWFFGAVDISGWFRIILLLYSCACALLVPFQAAEYVRLGATRFKSWTEGMRSHRNEGSETRPRTTNGRGKCRGLVKAWCFLVQKLSDACMKIQSNAVFETIRNWNDYVLDKITGINDDMSQPERKKIADKWARWVRLGRCFHGFVILALTIAGVEKIIDYNNLSPTNDLSRPGQLIPFVLGVITFLEGASNACMPSPRQKTSGDSDGVESLRGSVIEIPRIGLNAVFPDDNFSSDKAE
jgi:hypothetical protein